MQPELLALGGGWAALGDGWIAYAGTEREALSLFKQLLAVKPTPRVRRGRRRRHMRSVAASR